MHQACQTCFTDCTAQLLLTLSVSCAHFCAGVKSGTGIVDELILQKLNQWVKEMHMLCISKEDASEALGRAARQLDPGDLQQLQVGGSSTHALEAQ